jgi:hypothetical protein
MRNKFYYEVVKLIKEKLPLDCPVHVRRTATPQSISGDCWYDKPKKRFLIRVNNKLPQFWAIDVFIHEYAHALSWKDDKEDHGESWGIAYAHVYRTLLEHWYMTPDDEKVAKFKLQ